MHLQTVKLSQAEDVAAQRQAILDSVGDLSWLTLMGGRVLVGMLIEAEKTAGGIIKPQTRTAESEFQSKIGLVLAMGPDAFKITDRNLPWDGPVAKVGDWVLYRPVDSSRCDVGKDGKSVPCRLMMFECINGIVADGHTDRVW